MVMGIKTYDPRLQSVLLSYPPSVCATIVLTRSLVLAASFPPKNPKTSVEALASGTPSFTHEPSPELAASDLWDSDVRQDLAKKKFKKVELDQRRAKVSLAPLSRGPSFTRTRR